MKWGVYEINNSIHVIPEDDLKQHDYNPNCACNVKYDSGIYIHNSYDERELTENLPRC